MTFTHRHVICIANADRRPSELRVDWLRPKVASQIGAKGAGPALLSTREIVWSGFNQTEVTVAGWYKMKKIKHHYD